MEGKPTEELVQNTLESSEAESWNKKAQQANKQISPFLMQGMQDEMGFASVFKYCYTGVIECNAMWQAGSRTKLVSVYLLMREYSMTIWSLLTIPYTRKWASTQDRLFFPHKWKCVTGQRHTDSIVLTLVRTTQMEHCQAGQSGRDGCTLGQQKADISPDSAYFLTRISDHMSEREVRCQETHIKYDEKKLLIG